MPHLQRSQPHGHKRIGRQGLQRNGDTIQSQASESKRRKIEPSKEFDRGPPTSKDDGHYHKHTAAIADTRSSNTTFDLELAIASPKPSVPSEIGNPLRSRSPRSLYNKAPHYPRTVLGNRYWQTTDPHEDYCSICGMRSDSDLISCATCPKSYHPWCMVADHCPCPLLESWFCPICVERGWDQLDLTGGPESPALSATVSMTVPSTESVGEETPSARTSSFLRTDIEHGNSKTAAGFSLNAPCMEWSTAIVESNGQGSPDIQTTLAIDVGNMSHLDNIVAETNPVEIRSSHEDAVQPVSTMPQNKRDTIVNSDHTSKFKAHSFGKRQLRTPKALEQPTSRRKSKFDIPDKSGKTSVSSSRAFELAQHNFYIGSPSKTPKNYSSETSQGSGLRSSRYSSLPAAVEQAISVIFNELDTAASQKNLVSDLKQKVSTLEQELQIQNGKLVLVTQEREGRDKAENDVLRSEILIQQSELERLRTANDELAKELEKATALAQSREDDMAKWRRTMWSMVTE